jgi:hypothetical protein
MSTSISAVKAQFFKPRITRTALFFVCFIYVERQNLITELNY